MRNMRGNMNYGCPIANCPMMFQPMNIKNEMNSVQPNLMNYEYRNMQTGCNCLEPYRDLSLNSDLFYLQMKPVPIEEIKD